MPRSVRGEFELPQAVQLAIDQYGMRMLVVRSHAAVLDMSNRADIASMAERLRDVAVAL